MDDLALSLRAAQHLGDLTAQMHIDALWRAKGDADEARWMLNRLAAELRTTRRMLEATQDPEWWDTATSDDIANTYQAAVTWSRDHPDIAMLMRRMTTELEMRYNLRLN
ncbi:hypothetical protein HRK28_09090 [Rathayibacter sp. VKM Ac-2835]|uniref:hypothetical protein n=1 Tax=Rathayibacter sp. VKM Ac-2835 TaxID=2739043 RepID=UPI0015646273|nr:hypothetical protein [Rathayibacter sp. VKM Ac-2835]NRG41078.1 hypothetical protein [Rathayibacter sp. VKM Ac-2835]